MRKRSCATKRILSLILFTTIVAAVAVLLVAYSRGWYLTTSALAAGQMGTQAPATVLQAAAQGVDPPGTIDGARNPDLIPDDVAYRLFFITVAEPQEPTEQETGPERAFLREAGLEGQDMQSVIDVLSGFKARHDELISQYNDSVKVTNELGSIPDLPDFLSRQSALVELTRDALKAALSSDGSRRLEAYVEREKSNMNVAATDGEATAQSCSDFMTLLYSWYTSTSADGTNVYSYVTVSGQSSGICPTNCAPSVCAALHTPKAYNVLGTSGGWGSGPGQPWNNYIQYVNPKQLAAAPGTLVSFFFQTQVYCSVAGTIFNSDPGAYQIAQFTAIQHNYPRNPLAQPCRTSSFFDAVRAGSHIHRSEDVIYDNGHGTGGVMPAYGAQVYAMEAGTVVPAPGNYGPAPEGYPACDVPTGTHAGNYVKIQSDSDHYYTIYFHVKPSVTQGHHVNQGDPIGTLDNSGCQSGAHLHVQRKNTSGVPVNFTIPCTNPTPKSNFYDGLVDDYVDDNL